MTDLDLATLLDLDRAHLIHPLTELRKHAQKGPRIVTGGEGIHLRLADGREVIDGLSGLFNINVGHGRREIADAVHAQMSRLAYYPSFWEFSSEPAIRLAERVVDLLPQQAGLRHVLFSTGGSDANEAAFRIARLAQALRGEPARRKILSRRHSYHGITRAAGSATRLPVYHILDEPDPSHVETSSPYCFRCEFDTSFPGCGMPCVEDVERVIEREGAGSIAALIAEPVLGTGGILIPPPGYLERLEEICRAHGILLILDEVITGFGRTGRWFGMEHWGVRPDLVTFAKGVTSGYLPLGGVAVGESVFEVLRDQTPSGLPFMFGLTYHNHPACCAAALANLDIIEREGLVENAAKVGAHLLAGARERLSGHPLVADIRGLGLLLAIECTQPGSKDPVGGRPMAFPAAVSSAAWSRGLIVRALWESVALAPPLCTSPAEADEILDLLCAAFDAATRSFEGS
ncbi:MAG: aspartate aminotransferase family protein [Myxococcota bacterium]